MSKSAKHSSQPATLSDDELPMMPDPGLAFWKSTSRDLLSDSPRAIEEAAKQIIGIAGVLEGLYFHAIAYSNLRGKLSGWFVVVYVSPLICWLVSLSGALLVFFPRSYATNIHSARESRDAFERLVRYKHDMLKISGIWLALGSLALAAALGAYLAG